MKQLALGLALTLVLIGNSIPASADLERALRNYQAIISGEKALESLSPDELQEVINVHETLTSGGGSAGSDSRPSFAIEVAHNDEFFIINGEKYEAQTYCLGWYEGDQVVFLEGSEYGACASAKLLNLRTDEICDVWCE
jgi:hypothetical protein